MIPTLQYDTQFTLPSEVYYHIFLHILSRKPKYYYNQPFFMLSSEIIDDNIIIKCNSYRDIDNKPTKILISYSTEWFNIMYVLHNTNAHTKKLLLDALRVFPSKLLLIIRAIITISHVDIRYLLLHTFIQSVGLSYSIHTCAEHNGNKMMILCYSIFCGHVLCDKHDISRNVIKFVNETYDHFSTHKELAKALFPNNWSVDDTNKIYLISVIRDPFTLILGQIKESHVMLFLYVVNSNDIILNLVDDLLSIKRGSTPNFLTFVAKQITIDHIQNNWNLIDDKLC